ncbi:mitochondrial protein Pet127-domain-containing protein [Aspergillus aurantiobrunneus]
MFRPSLRSVPDLCEHVCFSCLARGLQGLAQARTFGTTRLLGAESGNTVSDAASGKSLDDAFQSLSQVLDSQKMKGGRSQKTKGQTKTNTRKSVGTKHGDSPGPSAVHSKSGISVNKSKQRSKDKPSASREICKLPLFTSGAIESREYGKLHSDRSAITEVNVETPPVPELSYGLQRVLFNPGVYHLRDPRSRVFNFDPYLGSIMPVTEFDFAALKEYITSSKDETLRNIATTNKRKYIGSSSSMTGVLSHFHYLLSAWRPINKKMLSQGFPEDMNTFTRLLRAPAAMILRYQDGVYAIDADKEFDSVNVLQNLGKSMEKLLTLPKEEFERYRRSHQNKITPEEEASIPESYHYSTLGDFLMRSQLDAYDPRLPGTGMFDLKTRAVVSIRMDARNFENGLGYQIKSRFGLFESYEREYFDMIRAAFLKYSLQVRIGRMDGIFVAFHNIERIFGFQYISLPEMDQTLHGQSDTALGDAEFRLSLELWNKILNKATAKYPGRSLRFHFDTRETVVPYMYIFFEPVTDEEIHAIQNKNKAEIDAYQQRILDLKSDEVAQDISSTLSNDQGGEDSEDVSSESQTAEDSTDTNASSQTEEREVTAIILAIVNRQNRNPVKRPQNFSSNDRWTVEYEMTELSGAKARRLYAACIARRKRVLTEAKEEDASGEPKTAYLKKLRELSAEGRKYRQEQDAIDHEQGVTVLDGVKL